MEQQTLAVLRRIVGLVEGQGGGVQNVYKLVIYVTDIARKDEVNKARAAFFTGAFPCSTLVEVKGLVVPRPAGRDRRFRQPTVDRHAGH